MGQPVAFLEVISPDHERAPGRAAVFTGQDGNQVGLRG
jgi:hypothetical protein